MTDVPTAVQNGVDAYAEVEKALQTAHDGLLKLPAVYSAIVGSKATGAATNISDFGYLESVQLGALAMKQAGAVANLLSNVIAQHQSDTARAQSLDIDIPAPPALGGGIHPDGGGR